MVLYSPPLRLSTLVLRAATAFARKIQPIEPESWPSGSGSPIQYSSVNANGQGFWLGKNTSTYCPLHGAASCEQGKNVKSNHWQFRLSKTTIPGVCPPGNQTVVDVLNGFASLVSIIAFVSLSHLKNIAYSSLLSFMFRNQSRTYPPPKHSPNDPTAMAASNEKKSFQTRPSPVRKTTHLPFSFRTY